MNGAVPKWKAVLYIVGLGVAGGLLLWLTARWWPEPLSTWVAPIGLLLIGGGLLAFVLWRVESRLPEAPVQLSEREPIRPVTYESLVNRLGRSGRIPWVNRLDHKAGLLRRYGRVAVIGWMKSGKTREAAELVRLGLDSGLITAVYEPTAMLDLIAQEALETAVKSQIDSQQRSLFFVDELGLRPEPERLVRLTTCLNGIHQVRPDTYFLITIQRERLTPQTRFGRGSLITRLTGIIVAMSDCVTEHHATFNRLFASFHPIQTIIFTSHIIVTPHGRSRLFPYRASPTITIPYTSPNILTSLLLPHHYNTPRSQRGMETSATMFFLHRL